MKIIKIFFYAFFCLTIISVSAQSQPEQFSSDSRWSITASAQAAGGKYIFEEYSNFYLLYGGLRYQTGDFSIYGYLPLVFTNNSSVTQSGMMVIPSGRSDGSTNSSSTHHGSGFGGMGMADMNIGLGDFYLYGSYNLLNDYDHNIGVSLNPNIKFPTASMGIGTGEFDYGVSLYIRKSLGTFSLLADAGVIKFGDPPGINYNNPFTYGIGVGKFISAGGNSVILYYNSYTQVLEGFEPPRQISLGLNIKLAGNNTLSFIGSKGLSNYSPDFNFSIGMNLGISVSKKNY